MENFDPKKFRDILEYLNDNREYITKSPRYFDGDDFVRDQGNVIEYVKYTIEVVDQEGGGEGEGEHWHSVIKVSEPFKNDRYFYIPGYYSSYDGTDIEWDEIYEVEPYEKKVIDWRVKK